MPMSFTIWFLMAAIFFALLPALVVLPIINRVAKVHNISPLLTRVGTEMASYPGAPLTHDGIPRVTKSLRTTFKCLQTFTQKNVQALVGLSLLDLLDCSASSPLTTATSGFHLSGSVFKRLPGLLEEQQPRLETIAGHNEDKTRWNLFGDYEDWGSGSLSWNKSWMKVEYLSWIGSHDGSQI